MDSVLSHILYVAKTEPVEAAVMFVQSTTAERPGDETFLPWSLDASMAAVQRFIDLSPEQLNEVRQIVEKGN